MQKILYLDESGDHNLRKIDPSYPVFVLGGIVVDSDYSKNEMLEIVNEFKLEFFGRTNIILHNSDIVRNRNGFENLQDQGFREKFYSGLNRVMSQLEYKVIAVVIDKSKHLAMYGDRALDPYMYSFEILIERFCFEIGDVQLGGEIYAESRGVNLDNQLELAWLNTKMSGTNFLKPIKVTERIDSLRIKRKAENIVGLQLADLAISPVARHAIGKRVHLDYEIISGKLRRDRSGNSDGYGIVRLP